MQLLACFWAEKTINPSQSEFFPLFKNHSKNQIHWLSSRYYDIENQHNPLKINLENQAKRYNYWATWINQNMGRGINQYRTDLQREHFLVAFLRQRTQTVSSMRRPGMASKLASTSKYFDAVFLTRVCNPRTTTNAEITNCSSHLRSHDTPETSIYDDPAPRVVHPSSTERWFTAPNPICQHHKRN